MTGLDGTQAASVVALHCSLGSGRQWTRLAAALGGDRLIAPDISGYGACAIGCDWPRTLDGEIARLETQLGAAEGPIHLVGHSYGGTIAFRMATASSYAHRIRSLTLIEPVLPTLLRDTPADARLYERFAHIAQIVSKNISDGAVMEAIEAFMAFWAGSGPGEQFSPSGQLRMIEQADKLACDFAAILGLGGVATAAAGLRVPTLLFSGGISPYVTQRIVTKLASIIDRAVMHHLPTGGHLLPVTHAEQVNSEILRHIRVADNLAKMDFVIDAESRCVARPALASAGAPDLHLASKRPSLWE
ncbi:alpha/beta fold hydrolase [Bradyrhizobium tropiciagri]|uniref:alpha/beta fold hydrolase n=1 Tax=Bradyrhizobium tropiciagri TaxID=312253 RepID=UPI001BA95F08|nr:alpha/beta fold hydrolase [Bradyrhizobium tropiciagri]MBR0869400.1 alpha/beta fold hydrolase [Bradyrhizobium tropiciagri]